MSFANDIKGYETQEISEYNAPTEPRIGWRNGQQVKTRQGMSEEAGFFYLSERSVQSAPSVPWQAAQVYQNEDGYTAEALRVAIIGKRSQAFTEDRDTGKRVWYDTWEKGRRIYTEYLALAEGLAGPIVWAAKGMHAKAIDTVLKAYKAGLLKDAAAVAGQKLYPWTFWLPFSTERDARGKIIYADTGYGSTYTPPAVLYPADPMDALYVGRDALDLGLAIHQQYTTDGWFQAKRTNSSEAAHEAVRTAPQPAGPAFTKDLGPRPDGTGDDLEF